MKENKQLYVEFFDTSRDFISFVNDKELQKEDILSLRDKPSAYTLFYYK